MKRLTYFEIPANDVARSAQFYATVVGWQTDPPRASDEAAQLIGRFTAERERLTPYFTVDDVADAVARVEANGGTVTRAPYREGDVLVARIRDPAGNEIGIWQFAEPKSGD
jgi:predicted enzyme related to lactoylglutathione lyase